MKQPAFNPYLPGYEYIPDAEPRAFGDRVYIYGSHDFFGGDRFCPGDYVCWSAPADDLGNWRNEGVIYRRTQDPNNRDDRMDLYAPDCVQGPDGRYYLYYTPNRMPSVSIAVSEHPAGPFEYPIRTELLTDFRRPIRSGSIRASSWTMTAASGCMSVLRLSER